MTQRSNKDDFVPLPNYQFTMSLPDSQDAIREFTKLMLRIIAVGFAMTAKFNSNEEKFSFLCRSSRAGEKFTFAAYLPHLPIVEFALAHLPPQMLSAELNRTLKISGVDVQHSYAVAMDLLLPMDVSYQPEVRHAVFANRPYFKSPREFLDPYHCRTTSGFLGFLGALSIAIATSGGDARQVMVFDHHKNFAAQGLGEWSRWLHHNMDHGITDTQRIRVSRTNPELYTYEYDCKV